MTLGAIERDGFTFDVEYSVMLQKGAVHVYEAGKFVREIPFQFNGREPDPEKVEEIVNTFFEEEA